MKNIVTHARHVVHVAVIGLAAMMLATFGWAVAKTVQLTAALITGAWRDDLRIIDLLEVIDTYLLGIVQLIVVIGLYELFIQPLDVPAWLKPRSLSDLKQSIVDVLVLFIGVKGIERILATDRALDALYVAAAVAVLIASLTIFRLKRDPGASSGSSANA